MSRLLRILRRAVGAGLVFALASCDSTSPPQAVVIVLTGGSASGTVNQPLDLAPYIEIRDASGNRMSGVAFAVSVASGGGSVVQTVQRTVGDGPTEVGVWTLGTAAGPQTLRVTTDGVDPLLISVTAEAGPPAQTGSGAGPLTASGLVGTVAVIQPSIRVTDAFGNPVAGIQISVTVTGGGSVEATNPVTNSNGVASAGQWTLGPQAGEQAVRLSAGLSAPVVVFRVQADPAPPVAVTPTVAQAVEAAPGQAVPVTPTVRVVDQFGNGIAGIQVSSVASAGGTITQPTSMTNANGQANAGLWTVGQDEGEYTVTMTAPGFAPVVFTANVVAPAYRIEIRYVGTPPAANVQAAINAAVTRIEASVAADLPSAAAINLNVNTACGTTGGPTLNEVVDDLVIFVKIHTEFSFFGTQGGTLAVAGPCVPGLRPAGQGFLPFVGMIDIDAADVPSLLASGRLTPVVLHEMMHVLGFGTMWQGLGLLQGHGSADPRFLGTQARTAFVTAGGATPTGVPAHNIGAPGDGSYGSHWRESTFDRELMSPQLNQGVNPFSAISIAALADMGYQVSLSAADPFTVPPPGTAAAAAAGAGGGGGAAAHFEVLRIPSFDGSGGVRFLVPGAGLLEFAAMVRSGGR